MDDIGIPTRHMKITLSNEDILLIVAALRMQKMVLSHMQGESEELSGETVKLIETLEKFLTSYVKEEMEVVEGMQSAAVISLLNKFRGPNGKKDN